MNDKEYKDLKGAIQVHSDRWRTRLGLRWWKIAFEYDRDGSTFRAAQDDGQARRAVAARSQVSWPYLIATIYFNMPELENIGHEGIEETIIHEFCHVLVNELREEREDWLDHEERVTTTLTNAFLWTRDDILKDLAKRRA